MAIKVLVAFECSGKVRDAFAGLGVAVTMMSVIYAGHGSVYLTEDTGRLML